MAVALDARRRRALPRPRRHTQYAGMADAGAACVEAECVARVIVRNHKVVGLRVGQPVRLEQGMHRVRWRAVDAAEVLQHPHDRRQSRACQPMLRQFAWLRATTLPWG
eukprot:1939603-Pleurochrysis_carterae.AAC.3